MINHQGLSVKKSNSQGSLQILNDSQRINLQRRSNNVPQSAQKKNSILNSQQQSAWKQNQDLENGLQWNNGVPRSARRSPTTFFQESARKKPQVTNENQRVVVANPDFDDTLQLQQSQMNSEQ